MGKRSEQFKALPPLAKVLVVVVSLAIGFAIYAVTTGMVSGAKKNQAVSACKDAVKTKIRNDSPSFSENPNVTDAAEGRFDVTGTVSANGVSASYDCLVDGDGSNADVEILP